MPALDESKKKKLKDKKKKINEKGGGIPYFIFKEEGTYRMRPVPVPEGSEFGVEVTFFYVPGKGGVISPATFGEPCAIFEKYEELSNSDDDADVELANKIKPRKKYMVPHLKFKDDQGKEPDEENGVKLALLTNQQFTDLIDCLLDDEWGDFTDPNEGYDIKYKREGKGQYDTEYTTKPCKPSRLPKKYRKDTWDPEQMVRELIPSYEQTEEYLNSFLNTGDEDDEDEEAEKKAKEKKKKAASKTTKGKSKSSTSRKKKSTRKSKKGEPDT